MRRKAAISSIIVILLIIGFGIANTFRRGTMAAARDESQYSSSIPLKPTIILTVSPTPTPTPTPAPAKKATTAAPRPKPTATPNPLPPATTFGSSVLGRPIYGYIFGSGADVYLLFGAIHGNEKGTVSLMNTLAQTIAANPALVSPAKKIIILPLTNPDGYYKNLVKVNNNNINLNRNFPTAGWQPVLGGYNAGSQPFSEPESRVIRDIVARYGVKKMISFHAKGSLVSPVANQASVEFARWYVSKTGYQYYDDPSWDYPGTSTKWFAENGGQVSVTVELSDFNASDWTRNRTALLEMIK